jgi:hypothetical protein
VYFPLVIGGKIHGIAMLAVRALSILPVLNNRKSAFLLLVTPTLRGIDNSLKSLGKSFLNISSNRSLLRMLFFVRRFILSSENKLILINFSKISSAVYPALR